MKQITSSLFALLFFCFSVTAQQTKNSKINSDIKKNTKVVSQKAGKNVEYVARESGKNIQKIAEKTAVGVEKTVKKIDGDVKKKKAAQSK